MNKFIVFEGLDASGKSTISKIVAKYFEVECIESPSEEFQISREYLERRPNNLSRFFFYLATNLDLSYSIQEKIKKNHVICSRYYFSTLIGYSYPLQSSVESLLTKTSLSHKDFYQPDQTILLYVDLETQKRRIGRRDDNCEADYRCLRNHEYSKDMFDKYNKLAKENDWVIIDTTNLSVDEVVALAIRKVSKIIG